MLLSSEVASDDPKDAELRRFHALDFFSSPISVRLFSLLPMIVPVQRIASDAFSIRGFVVARFNAILGVSLSLLSSEDEDGSDSSFFPRKEESIDALV